MSEVTRFRFPGETVAEQIEADIAVAILCAESIHGKPRVRMEISYAVDLDGKACVVETSGEAGDAVVRIFAGLTSLRLGEQGYSIERPLSGVEHRVRT